MKSFLVIIVGVGMLATASATAISTQVDNVLVNQTHGRSLTVEQTKILQAKYRYWSNAQPIGLAVPN